MNQFEMMAKVQRALEDADNWQPRYSVIAQRLHVPAITVHRKVRKLLSQQRVKLTVRVITEAEAMQSQETAKG